MPKIKSITPDTRYTRLVVITVGVPYGPLKQSTSLCRCDCGNIVTVLNHKLKSGWTKSCGCLSADRLRALRTTHAMSKTKIYGVWNAMVMRCHNQNSIPYKWYGGRGIRVCDRWRTFEHFLEDMGVPKIGLTLERLDNKGNYEPTNCAWKTRQEQCNNRRSNKLITAFGVTDTLANLSRKFGIGNSSVIRERIARGWSAEDALTKPLRNGTPLAV